MPDQTRTGFGTDIDESLLTGLRMVTQTGLALKNQQGKVMVRFQVPFATTPTVVLTPYWKNRASAAAFPETLDSVSREGFTIASNNAAPDYYVSWMAYGPIEAFMDGDPGGGGMGGGGTGRGG